MEKVTKVLWHRVSSGPVRGPASQRGSVLALVAVGMLAIIGMAGLALQSGHLFINKTHLQNALDAAALSAAKTLNNDGTEEQAMAAGLAAFNQHLPPESGAPTFLQKEMGDAGVTPEIVSFAPFPGDPQTFVRASVIGFSRPTWFLGVDDEQSIGGTAVAGPAPIDPANTCDVLPLLMCARNAAAPDQDCSDGACFGWDGGGDKEVCLQEQGNLVPSVVCPEAQRGKFRLLGPGGPFGRAVAGRYSGCVEVGATAATRNAVTVSNGLNTRFGEQVGLPPADYPPDTVTTQAPGLPDGTCTGFCYDQYVDSQHNEEYDNPPPDGVPDRRKVAVPIGDCPVDPGAPAVPVIGIGCFFLTREAGTEVYGQLVGECEADGDIATAPPGGAGGGTPPHRIVLYKDPQSRDS